MPTIKQEIEITQQSEDYIKEVLSWYTETTKQPKPFKGRTIIHIYPKEDTIEPNGNLKGFIDTFMSNVHIYNTVDKTVYKINNKDNVEVNVPCQVKIFKDLSTIIVIDKPIRFGWFQSLEINHADGPSFVDLFN